MGRWPRQLVGRWHGTRCVLYAGSALKAILPRLNTKGITKLVPMEDIEIEEEEK